MKNIDVAPHPHRKALQSCKGLGACRIIVRTAYVAIDAIGIWPIRLDSYSSEAFLYDQALCDLCTRLVELVCAVRSLTKQDKTSISNYLHQRVVVFRRSREQMCSLTYSAGECSKR